jgi:hypothetical protein
MNLPKTMAFRLALTWPVLPFVLILLLVAIINPFWFRDSMFNWIERQINAFSRWRDYHQYAIYLGADPRIWHTLKDSK